MVQFFGPDNLWSSLGWSRLKRSRCLISMVLSSWFHFHQTILAFVEGKAVSFLDFPATGSGYLVKTGIPTHSGRVKTQDVIQGKWW